MDLSVIILTFNEEANLPLALKSVKGWANEIFVVDSYSNDNTVNIALSFVNDGVKIVQHSFEDYSKQWNWALNHLPISSTWTLKLDADERVTREFKSEVTQLLEEAQSDLEGAYFKCLFYFMNTPIKYGGISSNYHFRIWRTGKVVFEDRSVNEHAITKGNTIKLKSYVEHHDYKSLNEWIDKHNRYSSLEAISYIKGNVTGDVQPRVWGTPPERRMWLRNFYYALPFRSLIYFFYRFVFRLGFLDGRSAFRYIFLHTVYRYWINLKILQYQKTGQLPDVKWPDRGKPHQGVQNSELQKYVDGEV